MLKPSILNNINKITSWKCSLPRIASQQLANERVNARDVEKEGDLPHH